MHRLLETGPSHIGLGRARRAVKPGHSPDSRFAGPPEQPQPAVEATKHITSFANVYPPVVETPLSR